MELLLRHSMADEYDEAFEASVTADAVSKVISITNTPGGTSYKVIGLTFDWGTQVASLTRGASSITIVFTVPAPAGGGTIWGCIRS